MTIKKANKFDVVSAYNDDPFLGHLATPITNSSITKAYLGLLPAYKIGLSPLLRGLNIGVVHGYFLLGPFVQLGPLRESPVANFIGFLSTVGLILILTTGLSIYGYVTYSKNYKYNKDDLDFQSPSGWRQFTSGFLVGGVGGTGIAHVLLQFVHFDISGF